MQPGHQTLHFAMKWAIWSLTFVLAVWNAACTYKDTCDGQTEQGNKIPPRDPKEQDPWFRSMQSAQSESRF